MSVTAKSVVFDIADNYPGNNYVGVRSIDFWMSDSLITMTTGFTAYATSTDDATDYPPSAAFDTSLSKTGSWDGTSWLSNGIAQTQRLIIVFDSPLEFDEIVVNNMHSSGNFTNVGIKDVVITASTDAITSTVYGSAISNGTVLFNGVFSQHVASNVEDPKTVYALVTIDIDFQEPTASLLINIPAEGVQDIEITFEEPLAEINSENMVHYVVDIDFDEPLPEIATAATVTYVINVDYQEPLPKYAIVHNIPYTLAKSVVFDIENNWAGTNYINIRAIEFWNHGAVIPMTSGFTAYATSNSSTGFLPSYAFNTSLLKTGTRDGTSWLSDGSAANQRLTIVFDTPLEFDEIVVCNGHNSGSSTNLGAKNVVITKSTDAITSTVYGTAISNPLELFNGTFVQHAATDTADPQTVYESPHIDIDFKEPLAEILTSVHRPNNVYVDINEHAPSYAITAATDAAVYINFIENRPDINFLFGEPIDFSEPLPEIEFDVSNPAVIRIDFEEPLSSYHVNCTSPLLINVDYQEPIPELAVFTVQHQSISVAFEEPTSKIDIVVQQASSINIAFVEPLPRLSIEDVLDIRFRLEEYESDSCYHPDLISIDFVEPLPSFNITTGV